MWERIDTTTERMPVPGGWIVRSIVTNSLNAIAVHQVFVADPQHLWEIHNGEPQS